MGSEAMAEATGPDVNCAERSAQKPASLTDDCRWAAPTVKSRFAYEMNDLARRYIADEVRRRFLFVVLKIEAPGLRATRSVETGSMSKIRSCC